MLILLHIDSAPSNPSPSGRDHHRLLDDWTQAPRHCHGADVRVRVCFVDREREHQRGWVSEMGLLSLQNLRPSRPNHPNHPNDPQPPAVVLAVLSERMALSGLASSPRPPSLSGPRRQGAEQGAGRRRRSHPAGHHHRERAGVEVWCRGLGSVRGIPSQPSARFLSQAMFNDLVDVRTKVWQLVYK